MVLSNGNGEIKENSSWEAKDASDRANSNVYVPTPVRGWASGIPSIPMRMNQPRLDIEDLTAVIRESMAAHQNDGAPRREAQTVSPETRPPHLQLQPDFQPSVDHRYHINDLLRYHDRVFVQAAYRAVLKRSP